MGRRDWYGSSARPAVLAHKIRLTMGMAVITCVVANVFVLVGGRQLLWLFGPGYAQQRLWSLRLLGLGAFPFLMKGLCVAISRIQDRIAKALLPLATPAVLEVGLAALGVRLGSLTWLSLGCDLAAGIDLRRSMPAARSHQQKHGRGGNLFPALLKVGSQGL